eukprot:TRINITY_DN40491_c0_g1_i1.p1 TRINITY_DN40491_c0_g1~~TRINITY_DN40491_c0_g1_i1.p1  ORF type:complete len:151 (+),score=11.50 TRINITY_DN40491_c0_g1_i1:147-599(+)
MSRSGWGGGIELLACSRCFGVNVHVYERRAAGYKRISAFDHTDAKGTVPVLYCGGVHYDALKPDLSTGFICKSPTLKPQKPKFHGHQNQFKSSHMSLGYKEKGQQSPPNFRNSGNTISKKHHGHGTKFQGKFVNQGKFKHHQSHGSRRRW